VRRRIKGTSNGTTAKHLDENCDLVRVCSTCSAGKKRVREMNGAGEQRTSSSGQTYCSAM
jgi:hypothetical protein